MNCPGYPGLARQAPPGDALHSRAGNPGISGVSHLTQSRFRYIKLRMYEVTIRKDFSAAHVLQEIGGKCEDLHGHNFIVEATIGGRSLNSEGILVDFRDVKKWLAGILEEFDHRCLHELPSFSGINPSSENIAKLIYERISGNLPPGLSMLKVTVWESDNARVSYTGSD